MDIDDLANQVAGDIKAEFFLTDWSYWNYNLTLIHVAGNLYKGTIEMSWSFESYSAGVEVVYDGNNYQWEVFDGLPDPEAPPPVDDYEVPQETDVVAQPDAVEPPYGFLVTCIHCNDCENNGNLVVCQDCSYSASDSYWPFDCKCPGCGKRLEGHHCASCEDFTPFNEMPDYQEQIPPQ